MHTIFGLGEGLGSAALIAAAGDPNEGQAINAIAAFAPYDSLPGLIQDVADDHLSGRLAGDKTGTPLCRDATGRH